MSRHEFYIILSPLCVEAYLATVLICGGG